MNEVREFERVYLEIVESMYSNKVLPKTIVFNRPTGDRLEHRGPFIVPVSKYNRHLVVTVTEHEVILLEIANGHALTIRPFKRGFCPAFVNGQVGLAY